MDTKLRMPTCDQLFLVVVSWSLRPFLEHLRGEGVDIKAVWGRVHSALVKTVLTAQALQV